MQTALEKINEAIYNWFKSDAKSVHDNLYLIEKINEIAKENTRPFSPELIVKMFEGWEYQKEHEILINGRVVIELFYETKQHFPYTKKYLDITGKIDVISGGTPPCQPYNSVIINDEGFVIAAPMPRTLDEFVTLCQQTEIELKERR